MENCELREYLKSFLGPDFQSFLQAGPEPRAIRVNTLKMDADKFRVRWKQLGPALDRISFNPHGFILKEEEVRLSHSLDFFLGYFQYQGLSSQIPPLVLNPLPEDKVLDMAAAPGSKATQLAALMKNRGFLLVNDHSRKRLQPLNANLQKAGALNQVITHLPGEQIGRLWPEFFDKILLDAPCTATGTLAENPEIEHWWSPAKLEKMVRLQEQLLISAYKALKIGGLLVYSTCSILPEENELLVQRIIDTYPLKIEEITEIDPTSFDRGITSFQGQKLSATLNRAVRVMPHKQNMEGFFIVKLRKTGSHKSWTFNRDAWQPTRSWNDPVLADDLKRLSVQYGIRESFWTAFRYIRTRKRIWMINPSIIRVPKDGFVSSGLLLAEDKMHGWKLFNQSVQVLGNEITKRRFELTGIQMKKLFAGGRIPYPDSDEGYYVLQWQEKPIASAHISEGGLSVRLPHHFDLILF